MRLLSSFLSLALIALAAAPAFADDKLPEPIPMPDFTLQDFDGNNVSLSEHLGQKVILINFWATWCTPCLKEMPKLKEMQAELGAQGFQWIAINSDEAGLLGKAKAILKRQRFDDGDGLMLKDPETKVIADHNPGKDMPFTLVIGKDGKIHYKKKGFTDGDEAKLKQWVEGLLAG